MTKSDLKTGMFVKFRNGEIYKVYNDTEFNRGDTIFVSILEDFRVEDDDFDENLYYLGFKEFDIVEIYSPYPYPFRLLDNGLSSCDLIWKRDEPKYYLRDSFIKNKDNYLKLHIVLDEFVLGNHFSGRGKFQVTFTDRDIYLLRIPCEKYEKVLVEGLSEKE